MKKLLLQPAPDEILAMALFRFEYTAIKKIEFADYDDTPRTGTNSCEPVLGVS